MIRQFPIVLAFAVTGCQSAFDNAPPPGLEARLARVEATTRMDCPASRVSLASTNAPRYLPEAPRSGALAARVDDLGVLLLGDMGDPPPAEHVELADAQRREDEYLRRPPLPSFWATAKRDLKYLPSDLWHDTKRVYANPVNLVILGSAYAGSLALQETGPDSTVEHRFNRDHDLRKPEHIFDNDDLRDAFGAMGNPGTHFAMAGLWYLVGQQTMDDKTYEVGKTLFSALTINGLTVMIGQAASSDRAPNGEWGTFPSGHTSSSFVVASVLHRAYGHLVGVPLYGLATLAGIERLDDREHYLSDVVMGAVLGTVVGHSVASGREPEFFGWKVLPYASTQGGSGVAFMKQFD